MTGRVGDRWSVPLRRVWYGAMAVLGAVLLIRNPPPLWFVAATLLVGGLLGYPRPSDDQEG